MGGDIGRPWLAAASGPVTTSAGTTGTAERDRAMKLLDTAGKTLKKAAAAVVKAVSQETARSRDPWYYDDERKAELNGRGRWLGRRRGWLR